jgi:soluble lytic murein transglycosylase-like protein
MRSRQSATIAFAFVALGATVANAAIFAFTDEQGVVHYSNVPADARYRDLSAQFGLSTPQVSEATLRKAERYSGLIERAARASHIEPALVRAVMVAESGCDPRALSKKGAQGLMQLMPATARQYGARDVFDPEENIRAGSRYLRDLADRYKNDMHLVLAAYNAGPAAVEQSGGAIPPLKETTEYVPRVLEIYRHLRELAGAR